MWYVPHQEVIELQKAGLLMTEDEILNMLKVTHFFSLARDPDLVVKFIDMRKDKHRKEDFGYYISFINEDGNRIHGTW